MNLTINRASAEEKPLVAGLLQLYLDERTERGATAIGGDGLRAYPWFDLYWSSPRRHPYLIRSVGRIAGFAFVRQREDGEPGGWRWQIAEFFVLPELRRRKIGLEAALKLVRTRADMWEFSYDTANEAARIFWKRVAACFSDDPRPIAFEEGRERYHIETELFRDRAIQSPCSSRPAKRTCEGGS
jgi:predicted acetyltransferase